MSTLDFERAKPVDVLSKAPAPNLYYLEAYAVISSQYPQYEYIGSGQLGTYQNHGGDELYIVTAELGYTSSRLARMNGTLLQQVQSQPIVDAYGNIEGWFRWWDASGFQSGSFTYQATSINTGPTLSDFLNVL